MHATNVYKLLHLQYISFVIFPDTIIAIAAGCSGLIFLVLLIGIGCACYKRGKSTVPYKRAFQQDSLNAWLGEETAHLMDATEDEDELLWYVLLFYCYLSFFFVKKATFLLCYYFLYFSTYLVVKLHQESDHVQKYSFVWFQMSIVLPKSVWSVFVYIWRLWSVLVLGRSSIITYNRLVASLTDLSVTKLAIDNNRNGWHLGRKIELNDQ